MEHRDGMGLVIKAIAFAAHKHRSQRRKDHEASPYINHPIELARVLWHEGGVEDPVTIAAAILHDTVEDTETTAEELALEFGEEIAAIVGEVTDDKSLPRAERKRRQVEHARHLSLRARQVKLADKICNVRDVAHRPPAGWDLERRRAYFDWAAAVVEGLRGANGNLEALFDEAVRLRP